MTDYHEEIRACFGCAIGSPAIDCGCGRRVFTGRGTDMDEGELEQLQSEMRANPKKYCEHVGCDSVVAVSFKGAYRVFGCDCKWEEQLGLFLDQNERAFVEYYKRKVARVQRELKASAETLAALGGGQ